MANSSFRRVEQQPKLRCSCGNEERFIEVMRSESHVVDSRKNYIHLLAAEVDHYTCPACGEVVEAVA